jgi:hypothetical protein
MASGLSRRHFLRGLGIGAGALVGTRVAGGVSGLIGDAAAATNGSAVVVIHLVGGFNALFVSADSFAGSGAFGVSAGNHTVLGNGVAIDNTWNAALSPYAKQHLAVLGVRHGISGHPAARRADWVHNNQNAGLVLAGAIGGTASIKAAVVGSDLNSDVPSGAVGGISFERISDMQSTIDAFGGGAADVRKPDRALALATMTASQGLSARDVGAHPESLVSLDLGYKAAVDTLKQPVNTSFSYADLRAGYALPTSTSVRTFASKLAAAELMVRTGTNVVSIFDNGWDSHGDESGTEVRNKMTSYVLAPLAAFINRMVDPARNPGLNVTLMVMGDFSRSLPGSDHQPNLSVAVFGRNVQRGTTGKVGANVSLAAGTPGIQGMWSYLAAASKVATNPFGANPHGLVA